MLVDPMVLGSALWLLALVFFLSGPRKLRHPELAAMTMVDFQVLRRVRRGAGLALGLVELGLAVFLAAAALWPRSLAAAAAVPASVLLWSFAWFIAKSLRAGRRFSCSCFGGGEHALSLLTLSRTVSFAVAASLAVVVLGVSPPRGDLAPDAAILQCCVAVSILATGALGGAAWRLATTARLEQGRMSSA